METNERLQKASDLLASWAKETNTPEPNRLDVMIAPGDLLPSVQALLEGPWGFLSAITGLDLGAAAGELEVLYHFCAGRAVVTLRVRLPRAGASIQSVCGLIPAASLLERELAEMFGITMASADYPAHFFLPEDWPAGAYPLRKDWQPISKET